MNVCPKCDLIIAVGDRDSKLVAGVLHHGWCTPENPTPTPRRDALREMLLRQHPVVPDRLVQPKGFRR